VAVMQWRMAVTFRMPEPFPYRNQFRKPRADGQDEPNIESELMMMFYEWQDRYDIQWEIVYR